MIDVWWIGPIVLAAAAGVAATAHVRQHRHRRAIAIGAAVAGGAYAVGWFIARAAMRGHAGAFESTFIQLVLAQLATFVFSVVTMIAGARGR